MNLEKENNSGYSPDKNLYNRPHTTHYLPLGQEKAIEKVSNVQVFYGNSKGRNYAHWTAHWCQE